MASKNPLEGTGQSSSLIEQLFENITDQINKVILEDVGKYYKLVADEVLVIMASALVVWIIYKAYQCYYGEADIKKTIRTIVKFVAITILIGSWGDVYELIAKPAIEGIPELVEAMTGTKGDTLVTAFGNKIFEEVAAGLGQLGKQGIASIAMAFPVALVYFAVLLGGVLIIGLYFLIFLQCKLTIALMVITSPIFLGFSVFDSTRKFFDNWVAVLITQFLTLLLLSISTFLIISILTKAYETVYPDALASLAKATGLLLGEVIAGLTFYMAPKMASNLASNGFSITPASIGNLTSFFAKRFSAK